MNNKSANKGGRPPKKENAKERHMSFRVTQEDAELIDAKVEESGLNRSDFIRDALLETSIVSRVPTEVIKILSDYEMNLRNIGTNLNTIAHKANIVDAKFTIGDIEKALVESKKLLKNCTEIKNQMIGYNDSQTHNGQRLLGCCQV